MLLANNIFNEIITKFLVFYVIISCNKKPMSEEQNSDVLDSLSKINTRPIVKSRL